MRSDFVHLHVHTQYSLLDGACQLEPLIARAVEDRMPALAVTDHGNLFGAIEFYEACSKQGVKPIIGCEVYVAPEGRLNKTPSAGQETSHYHLLLLVRDEEGYRNLIRLVSIGYLEGFYYRPRIDKEILARHGRGLIGLSACLQGEIGRLLLAGNAEGAARAAGEYAEILGKENFFLEVMDNRIPEQEKLNAALVELGRKLSIPLVATNDVHYLRRQDARAHEVLLCIQTQTTLDDPNRLRFPNDEFYFKTGAEMKKAFAEIPAAIAATIGIAERCHLEFNFKKTHLPHFEPPAGLSQEAYLRQLCEQGLKEKYPRLTPEVGERLQHELEVIRKTGYTSYFLIAHDAIRFARGQGIPVGPGRGSAAGSLVAYLTGITGIDPLRYDLLFERLLNPDRVSPPDIDIDFCYERRQEVIDYVTAKYGQDNVAQIITFGTMMAKGVVRDVARVMGFAYADADRIAKLIPAGLNVKLADAIATEPPLKELYENDGNVRNLLDTSLALEGLTRHASTHAAGVVISERPLIEYVPLFRPGGEGQITTGYAMGSLEKIGLLKMDFLGLRTLTVIDDTLKAVSRAQGRGITPEQIPLEDAKTFELLNRGRTVGVFQLESSGMRDLARKIGLEQFEDIIALVALFRPGPMHMLDDYVRRKHGQTPIRYDHPMLKPILENTCGIMLYQEQVIRIVNRLAGFSLGKADLFRRAIGKKIPEVIEQEKHAFVAGCAQNGISAPVAEKIYNQIEYFAGYGFNKSHSAAYAMIAYQTAFLKANHPREFMCALLTSEKGNTDKIVEYIEEAGRMEIEILPPDVNESFGRFTVEGDSIRFGLSAVKNVGEGAIESIVRARENGGPFKTIYDFCERIDSRLVNRKVIESLIKCGAFDRLGFRRAQLMAVLDHALESALVRQRDRSSGQKSFFDEFEGGNGFSTSAYQKIPDIREWPESQNLAGEKETLGFYVSGHPLARYEKLLRTYARANSRTLAELPGGTVTAVGGLITKLKKTATRKTNERMAILSLEDLEGEVEVLVYPRAYPKAEPYLKADALVFIRGKVDRKEEKPKLLADEVVSLMEVRERYTRAVKIDLYTAGMQESVFASLKAILAGFPGKIPVSLVLHTPENGDTVISCGDGLRVKPGEGLIEKVEELLGEDVLKFET